MERTRSITINLLQKHDEKGINDYLPLIITTLLLAVVGIGLGYFVTTSQHELAALRKANAQLESEAANYNLGPSWIKEIQDDIEKRSNIKQQLEKQKISYVAVAGEIEKIVPRDMVITGVDMKDGKVVINGYAQHHNDVACFLSGLSQSTQLNKVLLTSSTLNESRNVVEFTVETSWEASSK